MLPLADEERVLKESRLSPTLKKVFFSASIVLGFDTQIPFAYIAYKYNSPSKLNPDGIVMPAMVFAIDSWISVYSGYMGLKTLRDTQSLTAYEKQLSGMRKKMQSFASVLNSSPLVEIALFLKILPQEAVKSLIEETDLTISNLNNYIKNHLLEHSRKQPLFEAKRSQH